MFLLEHYKTRSSSNSDDLLFWGGDVCEWYFEISATVGTGKGKVYILTAPPRDSDVAGPSRSLGETSQRRNAVLFGTPPISKTCPWPWKGRFWLQGWIMSTWVPPWKRPPHVLLWGLKGMSWSILRAPPSTWAGAPLNSSASLEEKDLLNKSAFYLSRQSAGAACHVNCF